MVKAKRKVRRFVDYLFARYNVPRIPVYFHWYHDTVINAEGKVDFGVFCSGDDEKPCIHVSCKTVKTYGALQTLAHEFVHYLQYLHGWTINNDEKSEAAAEYYGAGLVGQWLINKKDKALKIDGLLEVWRDPPSEEIERYRAVIACSKSNETVMQKE